MDGLIFLSIVTVLAIPVCLIVLFVKVSRLNDRIRRLEAETHQRDSNIERLANTVAPESAAYPPPPTAQQAEIAAQTGMGKVAEAAAGPAPSDVVTQSGPWARATGKGAAAAVSVPPRKVVSAPAGPSFVVRLIQLLRENWVFVISAISLSLAGIFLVQYGIERGVLTPHMRVSGAVAFGLALVVAGEYMRRRQDDNPNGNLAYLPATFAGAGVVSLFAAFVAARQMYGLIGAEAAFAAQVAAAILAVILGWYNSVLLVAIGLLGAAASPFIVTAEVPAGPPNYPYYALIAALGLMVDTMRRWAWVSVLALVLGYLGGWASLVSGAGTVGFVGLMVALPVLATLVPERGWLPRQQGPSLTAFVLAGRAGRSGGGQAPGDRPKPAFPVWLVLGSVATSCGAVFLQASGPSDEAMLILGALALLGLAWLIWADQAEGLADVALIPALVFGVTLLLAGLDSWPVVQDFAAQALALRPPETQGPWTVSLIVGMAAAMSAGFAWRALRGGPLSLVHGLAATLTAPVAVAVLELTWNPAAVMGSFPWALHVIALSAAMVALATRFAARDGADHRRMAHATLSALSLVALALFILTSATALTLALAVLIVVAAALDRRFVLSEMGLFLQVGVAVLSWRLLIDPGIEAAMDNPLPGVLTAWGGVMAALAAAWWLIRPHNRPKTKGALESALTGFGAIFVNVMLTRWMLHYAGDFVESYWAVSLNAMPWLVMMLAQAYRARLGGALRRLRLVLSVIAGAVGSLALVIAVGVLNPLGSYSPDTVDYLVLGPLVLDTLALAYAVPGLLLLAAALRMPGLETWVRRGVMAVGAALAALYAGLEIRRYWRGDWLGMPDVTQPELYSYTIALMLLGAGLLYQALAKRSAPLRRIAMAVIALVIAKVFLIDASGLTGLTRVFSFLGLGLSLAGLAWLNRWVGDAMRERP